jgi:rSAM/selenodomain-associated transferase 2
VRTFQEQNSISVIIPTLDAGGVLGEALAAIAGARLIREIVVVDGGSRDDTVAVAKAAGARVIVAERGRGQQLAAGAVAASGEWLLFLHADCRLTPGWEGAVAVFLAASDAASRAGYFAFALDDASPAARRLERMVAWRCRAFGLPYGDQGLLIARSLYDAVGGFAALPLMEDVDLARRLGRGRLVPLDVRAVSSARRYRSGGYVRRPLRNLLCLSLYFAGVPPRRLARLYR